MKDHDLFTPVTMGELALSNRVVMAPMTRNRARAEDDAPYDIHATYYAQRAGAGLIISEATQVTPEGKGYAWTPGIHSDAQIEGWKKVTDAVHREGGKIFLQLWHVGRMSHVSLQPGGQKPVAPSAIGADAQVFDGESFVKASEPRALETDEMPRLVDDFRKAARNAKAAGFDGVEIHAANGYLLDQFLRDGANKRTDGYGGSADNRARLLMEVTDAVCEIWPSAQVGVRISPFSNAGDLTDSDPVETFSRVVSLLNTRHLGYLHVVEGQTGGPRDWPEGAMGRLRALWDGCWMGNNGYDKSSAMQAVDEKKADLIAVGVPFIANPDLVARWQADAPLNEPDQDTFYGGGAEGYIDYPKMSQRDAA